ncbi:MFS transporter [Burkholderia multivorans]|uniref:MFS transporter n=1 Tax=Burkholderia multivorans TaxID=87883 RepID=UPI000F508C79|nr:MFS transporter [Burkholderia multivorans]AYY55327.1 MFS transporter [Burkholderia multivorans]MCA8439068.1 MFS transporter [Burkholderia multivorans]
MSNQAVVEIQTFINTQRFSRFQWLIFFMCFVIVLLDGIDTASIGFIAPSLVSEWHLSKPDLAPVMSAALFGLALGSLTAGPISDRFGRRIPLICSIVLFGGICLASALARTLDSLTIMRFLMGLGLGAAMPNAITLLSEFCPEHRRSTLITLLFCAFGLGAAAGGAIASWLIPAYGWRSMLVFGGVAPLLLALLVIAKMPESVRFMVARAVDHRRIQQTLSRISGTALEAESFVQDGRRSAVAQNGIAVVLSPTYALGSVMLWIAYFMGLVIFYGVLNWMPILLKDAGLGPRASTLITAVFPMGGLLAFICGALMDRFNATIVLSLCYLLCAVCVFCIGQSVGTVVALVTFVLLSGILVNTAQSAMPALTAAFYPTSGRGTGIAWMLGIGRFGGIAGSFLVAELTRRSVGFAGVFATLAAAGVCAALALLIKLLSGGNAETADDQCKRAGR